jgi:8-amino-7-oxononanoate synthase
MVFGNMGDDCATGVAFTRDPSTGAKRFFGEFLVNAQGEDVVAGIRTPQPINDVSRTEGTMELDTLQKLMPKAYGALVKVYQKLEKQIAKMKNCSDAVVFSSGYAAAIGAIPALVGAGDLIVADRLIHSCLIDAAKLSGARLIRFLHNDISHAAEILTQNRHNFKKCLIVTESVFSMDGDLGKIDDLLQLAQKFDCFLLSDCAHDLFLDSGLPNWQHLKMGTFSKSAGALGGYVAGNATLIDYLRNFAKSQIYSTALPPAILAASLASLKIIEKKNLGAKALKNAQFFCQLMNLPNPQSAIVPIILHDNKKVLKAAKKLEQNGFLVSAIRPPTVENKKARLRFTFSSAHQKKQIVDLASLFSID